MIPYGVNSMPA